MEDILLDRFRRIRLASGYLGQPDHSEKSALFRLLAAETRIRVRLTKNDAMWPGATV